MPRKKLEESDSESGGSYFASPYDSVNFIKTGATTLDCTLSGGWALGRIANIVGDKSTGKTLLAIEAMANFARDYPEGKRYYCEVEAAFDKGYAAALGMPDVEFVEDVFTVEDFYEDLKTKIEESEGSKEPALYILDSLDALSDQAELDREIGKGSFGAEKAKKMSETFRRLTQKLESSNISLIVISQVRDNMNAMAFGKKTKRSGGRALDFYCSQVIFLAHVKQLTKTIKGVKRPIGVQIKVKCEKNKIGLPFRECEFPILFAYGIDDFKANVDWLLEHDKTSYADLNQTQAKDLIKKMNKMSDDEFYDLSDKLSGAVGKAWRDIEIDFIPKRKKY